MIDKLNKHYKLLLWLIPVVSLAMHWQVFSKDLVGIHVWRQTQTQTVINNFYKEDMNILNPRINEYREHGRIQRMEFPVMQWVFAGFHKVLGDDIAITRVLSFILGLLSVLGMFHLCHSVFKNKAVAALGAWTFNFSPLFYYYTVNPLPDNLALCCAIWSVALFFKYIHKQRTVLLMWSALMLCLATLAKLPFIIYGAIVPTYLLILLKNRQLNVKATFNIALTYILLMLPAFAWYAWVIPTWEGNGVVAGILDNRPSGAALVHILRHHLVSALPEMLLNYGSVLFFIAAFYYLLRTKRYRHRLFPVFIMWSVAVIVYFLFEMNMISTVHDYYLLPFLPVIFLLAAYGAYHTLSSKVRVLKYLSVICLLLLPVTAWLRVQDRWDVNAPGFDPAYYRYKNELRILIPKEAKVVAGNDLSHFILLYYIDRKGWAFDDNRLDGKLLAEYIGEGAGYLFTDSGIDTAEQIKVHLGDKIFEKEDLRVYKLK